MTTDPFFGRNPVVKALQRQRSQAEQTAENTARTAWSWGSFDTTGSGEIVLATPQAFTCTFIYEPDIAHGFSIDPSTPPKAGRFPRVSAGVSGWVKNSQGFFTGAYVFFAIDTSGPDVDPGPSTTGGVNSLNDPPPSYLLHHTFTFSGVALKDLPSWATEE